MKKSHLSIFLFSAWMLVFSGHIYGNENDTPLSHAMLDDAWRCEGSFTLKNSNDFLKPCRSIKFYPPKEEVTEIQKIAVESFVNDPLCIKVFLKNNSHQTDHCKPGSA